MLKKKGKTDQGSNLEFSTPRYFSLFWDMKILPSSPQDTLNLFAFQKKPGPLDVHGTCTFPWDFLC
jgi:hypothetical protein